MDYPLLFGTVPRMQTPRAGRALLHFLRVDEKRTAKQRECQIVNRKIKKKLGMLVDFLEGFSRELNMFFSGCPRSGCLTGSAAWPKNKL